MTIENLLKELIEAVKENTREVKFSSEMSVINNESIKELFSNTISNVALNIESEVKHTEKASKPKKVKEETKEEVKENPVEKTLAAYAEIKKEEAKEEITVQSAIALAKDKMREGVVRSEIKKKISELKAEEIAELTQENLAIFYNWLKDLKAE
jgi:hypothetical protein